jgi:hypothetical protein
VPVATLHPERFRDVLSSEAMAIPRLRELGVPMIWRRTSGSTSPSPAVELLERVLAGDRVRR